jgi:GPH family glycoside/pentoside/hexuronide:cation symporter
MMSDAPREHSGRVPVSGKLLYGAAGPVDIWATWVPLSMANQVFNMALGLSPTLVSLAFAIFRLYDAVLDPVMGWVSDNARTRWGRRRPFIFAGAIGLAATFPLIWMVGRGWSPAVMTGWLIVMGLLFFTFHSMWNMPYQSMLLEMTADYNERTSITSYRALFQNLASIVVTWVWAITQLPFFVDAATGRADTLGGIRAVSFVMAILILVLGLLPALFLRERHYAKLAEGGAGRVRLVDSFRKTLSNRPFQIIIAFSVLFAFGTSITGSFGAYVTTYYVFKGSQAGASVITGIAGTVGLGLAIASLPVFNALSRRFGKTRTLFGCLGLQLLANGITWWTYNPAMPSLILVTQSLIYIGNAGLWVMLPSMLADMVDDDELHTGERREGSFAAVFSWVLKVSMTVGFALSGPMLELTGFDVAREAAQADGVIPLMRLLMTLVPTALLVVAWFVLRSYPLSPARMADIRAELEQRRGTV